MNYCLEYLNVNTAVVAKLRFSITYLGCTPDNI